MVQYDFRNPRSLSPTIFVAKRGYCTPGMLATARDIVIRPPDANERRVRLELAGNLCRCTGYVGIVNAIKAVLEKRRG